MSEDIEVNVDTRALDKMLSDLPIKVQRKYLKSALQAAGDVILEAMVQLAPERTDEPTPDSTSLPPGILRADLHTQVIVSENSGARVKVGPGDLAGHVAKWVNNGWRLSTGKRGKGQSVIRDIPGKHFMESAEDESSQLAVDVFTQSLASSLDQDSTGSSEN